MLPIPVGKTKIIPPRRRDELLARKRLLDLLFDALDKKLALVSAPAGYGKTSLLIDLVKQSELKCCWLSLDELDREPQRFITYLVASVAERYPGFGNQTLAAMNGITSLENEMERIAVTLVNEAFDLIKEHFVLILDDFHLLEGVQPIYDLLNRFIQLVDDNCHIIIASRTLTTLSDLPLMVAREQVSGLSFSDLAFRTDEIQALILQNNKVHISDEEAQKLIDETEGWITGLQFSGNNFSRKGITKPISNTGVGLFDYLGQQVVDRQKPELRDFLLRTSLMDEFDTTLCESALSPLYKEKQDWDSLIKAVLQNNLFALPVGADGGSLRYHHLFRDYLRLRMEREKKDEIHPILERLVQAYEAMGEWEKAHYVARQLGDMNALAGIVERASYFMLQRSLPIIEGWLNELPPSIIKKHPGVISVSGAIKLIKGDLREGVKLLDQAVDLFHESGNNNGLAVALTRRSAGHRYLGDYPAAIHDADEAIRLTEDQDDLQAYYAEALHVKGLSLYRSGQTRLALEFFERSSEVLIRLYDKLQIPRLQVEIGMAFQTLGKYQQANDAYQDALRIWKQDGNIWSQTGLLNNMGNMYHQAGEYEKAAHAYEEGLLCAQRSHNMRGEALISIGQGDLYAELQDFGIASQSYQHAEAMLRERQDLFLLFSLRLGMANLALLSGNLDDAGEMMEAVEKMAGSSQSHYENGHLDLLRGKLCLHGGDFKGAVAALKEAESHFEQDGRALEHDISRVWLAAAYHSAKSRDLALRQMKEVVNERGLVEHVTLVAVAQARAWLHGLEKDKEIGRLMRDVFSRSEQVASKFPFIRREIRRQARSVHMPAPRLFIRAFGNSSVSISGRVLSLTDWQTQSVRDLFFFFLTQTRPLTKEQAGGILWPEIEEPAKISLRFKNELYRLRRAVGQDVIRFENPLYSFNHNLDYEYDVDAFESYLSKARSLDGTEEQVELYCKAVDLYGGPFLNDVDFDWVTADRERLSQLYLSALLTLAGLYQKQARLEECLAMCKRAMDYAPDHEAAYRLSMQVYRRLGDRPSVIRIHQACVGALKQFLNRAPSKETEELYQKLIL
jgi:ATP/maltotriose-dependent transcriptional regulator MalT/two-component SAPR family response regulator